MTEIRNIRGEVFKVRDSGRREEFGTGSRRDSREGKGRFDLIPTAPLRELALHYEQGAVKYGDHNWKKGQPLMRYIDSAQRHLNELVAGEETENHAIAVAWNMFSYRWTLAEIEAGRLPAALDDRPEKEPRYLYLEEELCPNCITPWKCNGPHIGRAIEE